MDKAVRFLLLLLTLAACVFSVSVATRTGTAFRAPLFLVNLVGALVAGLFCVFRPEAIRTFVARSRPSLAERFRDAEAHRRFISFCGWAILAIALESSLVALFVQQ